NEGIRTKSGIFRRVRNNKEIPLLNRDCAERNLTRCFTDAHADLRFEPLPVGINQRDQRNRSLADMRGQDGKVVEALFRIGVENFVTAQRLQTGVFLGFHSDLRLSARNDSKSKRFCRGGEIPSGSRAQVVVHSSEDEARAITPAPLFSLVESSN